MKRKLHGFIWREGDAWVSQCVDINVASYGSTKDEARANLIEALELYRDPPTDTGFVVPAGDFELEVLTIGINFGMR